MFEGKNRLNVPQKKKISAPLCQVCGIAPASLAGYPEGTNPFSLTFHFGTLSRVKLKPRFSLQDPFHGAMRGGRGEGEQSWLCASEKARKLPRAQERREPHQTKYEQILALRTSILNMHLMNPNVYR